MDEVEIIERTTLGVLCVVLRTLRFVTLFVAWACNCCYISLVLKRGTLLEVYILVNKNFTKDFIVCILYFLYWYMLTENSSEKKMFGNTR